MDKLLKLYDELESIECPVSSNIPYYDNCDNCYNRFKCENLNKKIEKRKQYLMFIDKNKNIKK